MREKGTGERGTFTGYWPRESAQPQKTPCKGNSRRRRQNEVGEEWREHARNSLCKGPEMREDLVPLKRIVLGADHVGSFRP